MSVTNRLIASLTSHGVQCALTKNPFAQTTGKTASSATSETPDMLIVVGGDGTILDHVAHAAQHDIPVLGINLGKVGFLTEAEPDGFDSLAFAIAQKQYRVEKRTMLCAQVEGARFYALNEFVLMRRHVSKMIMLRLAVGDEEVDKYYCDGMIVCTATGSTAYSLSAGGPVISPQANVFAVTPVNSHSLHSRPIVIGDTERVALTLLARADDAMVLADGKIVHTLPEKQTISIFKAQKQALFVRFSENKFYGRLLGKLNTWSLTPEEETK